MKILKDGGHNLMGENSILEYAVEFIKSLKLYA